MAKSSSNKASILKNYENKAYGYGASIVILGALFKLLHWELGPIDGGLLLAIGLITEALIFAYAAMQPVEEPWDWSRVYPELIGQTANEPTTGAQGILSQKIDSLLAEAKIDAALMEKLSNSMRQFEAAAQSIAPTAEAMRSTQQYAQELDKAAQQMQSLNQLYAAQLTSAQIQKNVQESVAENAAALQAQMQVMSQNLASLNAVYSGMLHAMNKNN
ncbi:MAG: gliding motility protein GldL [Flavobacteriaceae bacterium]